MATSGASGWNTRGRRRRRRDDTSGSRGRGGVNASLNACRHSTRTRSTREPAQPRGRYSLTTERRSSMTIAELIQEFEAEARTTRRVLERVPGDKLTWTPHTKSMSLGRLAMHLASAPAAISTWPIADQYEFKGGDASPLPTSTDQIIAAHDKGVEQVKANLEKIGDSGLGASWSGVAGGKTLMTMPKGGLLRGLL